MKTAGTNQNFYPVPVQPLSGVTYNNRMFTWTSQQQTDTKRNYFFTIKFPRFKTGSFNSTVSYQSYEYHVYLASYQISNNTITEVTKIKLLKSFDVEAHDNDDANKDKNIEIFFTINNNAPANIGLYFELIPTLYDYQHPTGKESRIYWIWEGSPDEEVDDNPLLAEHASVDTIGEFCRITNMITGNQIWNKIGVQTRPGVLLVVNRQPIRVGRSGIYEIYNGINIFQLAIITPGASTDYTKMDNFIIDYAYQS